MIERWVYIVAVPTPLLDDPDFWKWISEPDENEDEMIWGLIKKFMKATEDANNIQFADSAWQRAKQLDADIEKYISDIEAEHRRVALAQRERIKALEVQVEAAKELAAAWEYMRTSWNTRGFTGQSRMIDDVNEAYETFKKTLHEKADKANG